MRSGSLAEWECKRLGASVPADLLNTPLFLRPQWMGRVDCRLSSGRAQEKILR